MRTVFHVITGLGDGGAESMLVRLCREDRSSRHIVVSMTDGGKYAEILRSLGVTVYCLFMPRGKISGQGLWKLFRHLKAVKPHVVQTWLYHADLVGGLMARLAGIHNINWGVHHSNLTPGTVKTSTILVAKICAFFSRWVPASIVCCSEFARQSHVALGYEASRFRVIPNGYDLSEFCPNFVQKTEVRSEMGLCSSVPVLGMVARFDRQKDHENLIRALGYVKRAGVGFVCLLVGSDIDSKNTELASWIESEGLCGDVKLLGRRSDVPAIMNGLDINVLSSLGEAFPNVLSEAMACGTPCVTTDVGDAGIIVGDTGWVVPAHDSRALATAIISAISEFRDGGKWHSRQVAARARVQDNFSIQEVARMYCTVWDRA